MDTKTDDNVGYRWLSYITKTIKTTINGETVWHSNPIINIFIKIKSWFIKPKYLKNGDKYSKNPINPNYYKTFKIQK